MKNQKTIFSVLMCSILILSACKKEENVDPTPALGTNPFKRLVNPAPLVSSTNPEGGATGVSRNSTISVVFNEPMTSSSINTNTFIVKQGDVSVSGTIAYLGNTATFTPIRYLDASKVYTATITKDVLDVGGMALAANKTWNFTIGGSPGTLARVELGKSANYVILAKTAINNSPTSAITGGLGLSPAATSYITGLALVDHTGYATSAQVTGKVYAADMVTPTSINLTTAVNNMITAYNDAAGRPSPDFLELGAGNVGGMTLVPGLYKWAGTVSIASTVTLEGGPNDVWIFQIAGDLKQSAGLRLTLKGGAQAKNIFWQVAGEATFASNSHFEGNILSMTGITFVTGASLNGRALAQTAVILDANIIKGL
ncbi:MAG: DUF3494 domain-containing protein [Flavobacteriales bacterium]|nr:DUF3494 domain-containing protein [Flavobacteriales bacterium]